MAPKIRSILPGVEKLGSAKLRPLMSRLQSPLGEEGQW